MPHPGDPGVVAMPGVCPTPGLQGASRSRGLPDPGAKRPWWSMPGVDRPPPGLGSLGVGHLTSLSIWHLIKVDLQAPGGIRSAFVFTFGLVTLSDLEAQRTWQIETLTRGPYPTWTFAFVFYSAWSPYPTWKLNGPGKFPL